MSFTNLDCRTITSISQHKFKHEAHNQVADRNKLYFGSRTNGDGEWIEQEQEDSFEGETADGIEITRLTEVQPAITLSSCLDLC